MKNPKNLDTWIKYHLHLGFDYIFICFEDTDSNIIQITKKYPKVIILNHQKNINTSQNYFTLIQRQMNNMDFAIHKSKQMNIKWLLHIDDDELFYLRPPLKLHEFLNNIPDNINHLKFTNFEIYPTKTNSNNCFLEQHHFKTQPYYSRHFNSYANGKSMARITEYTQSNGSHEYKMLSPGTLENLDVSTNQAIILHYDSCNFDRWWAKFKNLGKFSDNYGSWVNPFAFYKKSRDIISDCDDNNNKCKNKALQYYQNEKILKNHDIPELIKQKKIEIVNPW